MRAPQLRVQQTSLREPLEPVERANTRPIGLFPRLFCVTDGNLSLGWRFCTALRHKAPNSLSLKKYDLPLSSRSECFSPRKVKLSSCTEISISSGLTPGSSTSI